MSRGNEGVNMNRPRKWSAGQLLSSLSPANCKTALVNYDLAEYYCSFCIASHAAIILKISVFAIPGRRLPLREEMMRESQIFAGGLLRRITALAIVLGE